MTTDIKIEDTAFLTGVVDGARIALDISYDIIFKTDQALANEIKTRLSAMALTARDVPLTGWAGQEPSKFETVDHTKEEQLEYVRGDTLGANTICNKILNYLTFDRLESKKAIADRLEAAYKELAVGDFNNWGEAQPPEPATPAPVAEKLDPEGFVTRAEIPRLVAEYLIASLPYISEQVKGRALFLSDFIRIFMEAAQGGPLTATQQTALWNSAAMKAVAPLPTRGGALYDDDDYGDYGTGSYYSRGTQAPATPPKPKLKRGFQPPEN